MKIPNTTVIKWKNKDGSFSTRYRVRINRVGIKVDEVVDTEEQALELVNQSRSKLGKAHIKIEQAKKEEEKIVNTDSYSMNYLVNQFVDIYYSKDEKDTELQRRNKENKRSLYKNILNTKIRFDRQDDDFSVKVKNLINMDIESVAEYILATKRQLKTNVTIGSLQVFDIDGVVITDYIREKQKQGRKGSSILTDITALSLFFRKIYYTTRNQKFKNFHNPCSDYDHDLLKGAVVKRERRLSDDELKKIYDAMTETQNIQMFQIVLLSLYTALRRSEVILLHKDNLKGNFLRVKSVKTDKMRNVYLTKQAKDLLDMIDPNEDGRLFNYSIAGFDRNWQRLRKKYGFADIKFHDLRRESISRFVEGLAGTNTLIIAEMLGISNIERFEKDYVIPLTPPNVDTEIGIMQSINHSSKAVTHRFYYSIEDKTKL